MTVADLSPNELQLNLWLAKKAANDTTFAILPEVKAYAKAYHNGTRKNGEPEFSHQVAIAWDIACLLDRAEADGMPPLPCAADLLKAALCHDMLEDWKPGRRIVTREELKANIGTAAESWVFAVSHKYYLPNGALVRKSPEEFKKGYMNKPQPLLIRQLDRKHNLKTMFAVGADGRIHQVVYTAKTQREKLEEAIDVMLPAAMAFNVRAQANLTMKHLLVGAAGLLTETISQTVADIARFQILRKCTSSGGVEGIVRVLKFPRKSVCPRQRQSRPRVPTAA